MDEFLMQILYLSYISPGDSNDEEFFILEWQEFYSVASNFAETRTQF